MHRINIISKDRKSLMFLITGIMFFCYVLLSVGCISVEDFEDSSMTEEYFVERSALDGSFTTSNCSTSQNIIIHDAMGVLIDEAVENFSSFTKCLRAASLIEHKGHTAYTIASKLVQSHVTRITCYQSDDANAEAYVNISGERMWIDNDFLRNSTTSRIASVIAHEIMHNRGYSHRVNDYGSRYYSLTVPEQVEACISRGNPNSWPGPNAPPSPNRILGITSNSGCNCVYFRGGYASCGSTDYLSRYTQTYYEYDLPSGYNYGNIRAIGNTGGMVCAFYSNGMASCGYGRHCRPVTDFSDRRSPYRYTSPTGFGPNDIIGVGGDDRSEYNNWFFWYDNGYVSGGSSSDHDSFRRPYGYDLAPGYTESDVVALASDGDFTCVWYDDRYASCGTTSDLDRYRTRYRYNF